MGRHTKEGLDYFPVDIDIFGDHKILYAQELVDPDGTNPMQRLLIPYVAIRLLAEIYKQGYYIEWNKAKCLTMASSIGHGITINSMRNFTQCLIDSEFFSTKLYHEFEILTSAGIQKRWLFIVKSSNRKKVSILPEYELLTLQKKFCTEEIAKSTEEIAKSQEESAEIGEESAQIIFPFLSNNTIVNSNKDNSNINTLIDKNINKKAKSTEEKAKSTDFLAWTTPEIPEARIKLKKDEIEAVSKYGEEFLEVWELWVNYHFNQNNFVYRSIQTTTNALTELSVLSEGSVDTAIKIIKKSMSRGWRAFYKLESSDKQQVTSSSQKNNPDTIKVMSGNAPIEEQEEYYRRKPRN